MNCCTGRNPAPEMRKVLIVSPRFPPTNAADMHRVRMSLGLYRRFGWEPTVLCVDSATSDCPEDPMLMPALPPQVRVVRVSAWDEKRCRRFGFGQLGWRSLLPLYRAGSRLFRRERHEVVFFSTTVFTSFLLARLWKRQFGCKIVYDFQDPWYSDVRLYTRDNAPGGWWKYRLDQRLAKHLERFALRAADHIVAVSDGYVTALTKRYSWLDRAKFTVLPFAASREDYDFVAERAIKQTTYQADCGHVHWVSVGRAGPDMVPILEVLFQSIAALKARAPEFAAGLRLHFVGTNYAPEDRTYKLVEPLALSSGVDDLVSERSLRVSYFQAVAANRDSDAILLIGSVHADYTPSKLLTCMLAKKPTLALFNRASPATRIAATFPNVFLATFDKAPSEAQFRASVEQGIDWLRAPKFDSAAIDDAMMPWTAETLTQSQCAVFDRVAG
jgi:hypothetical protein